MDCELAKGIFFDDFIPKSIQKNPNGADHYVAQCEKCFKWRLIPTIEEFEDIRSKLDEDPFFCDKIADTSCEDPGDIEYDSSRTWVSDEPNLPKTPKGFQRKVVLREDYSKMDVSYITPDGKRIRSIPGAAAYLAEHPEYKDLSVSDFSFISPKVMLDTVPEYIQKKGSASSAKRIKISEEEEDD